MVTRRAFAAAGLFSSACARKAAPLRTLRVSVGPRVTMAPTYLAHERGYFKAEALDVSLIELRGGREALPLLAGGEIDASLFSFLPSVPNAISRGARIRLVAGRDCVRPGCSDQGALYYSRSRFPRGPKDAADWKRARVALSSDSANSEFYLDALLNSAGVSPGQVKAVRLSMEQAVAATVAGHIDLFFGSGRPNFIDRGLPPDVVRTDLLERTLGEFQYSHILFGSKLLDGDVKAGAGFLRAYLRGVREFVGGETPQFLNDYAKRFKLDIALLLRACRDNITMDGALRLKDLERWLDWAERKKYLKTKIAAAELVDMRFQREAVRAGT